MNRQDVIDFADFLLTGKNRVLKFVGNHELRKNGG